MELNDKEKEYVRFLVDEINLAKKYEDVDYWKATFRRIDNIPRETTIKMLYSLVRHFDWVDELSNQKPQVERQ